MHRRIMLYTSKVREKNIFSDDISFITLSETSYLLQRKSHNENMPMQYNAIFHGCKNVKFQMKNYNIFLIFAQNIKCGYTLEPPQ